ncbi:D-tyrosyl-tRNA(Tyr) deacylase [bacterium]|nr:D-tyrosyl-tRNA(Tyr) deacylase [bacterium]
MRLLIERVKEASCKIDNIVKSSISKGFLTYVCFEEGDDINKINKAVYKLSKLRIFEDDNHKMNLSIEDINGEILIISSFSLYADALSGNRPSFSRSLTYNKSIELYNLFIENAKKILKIKTGEFGADMEISAINDGPVSIILDI